MTAVDDFLAAARLRVARMDAVDRRTGLATPAEVSPLEQLRVAILAAKGGLATEDWDCVAESVVMLEALLDLVTDEEWRRPGVVGAPPARHDKGGHDAP